MFRRPSTRLRTIAMSAAVLASLASSSPSPATPSTETQATLRSTTGPITFSCSVSDFTGEATGRWIAYYAGSGTFTPITYELHLDSYRITKRGGTDRNKANIKMKFDTYSDGHAEEWRWVESDDAMKQDGAWHNYHMVKTGRLSGRWQNYAQNSMKFVFDRPGNDPSCTDTERVDVPLLAP
ncbi:hypothetical protein ACL9RL_01840 [Plantibacter sp. Mn2098]|uniref:hypothetical protein n=1 Tax=Plantibacter sp. Mn2098 TaxID=3395266 RepID=UPI003BBF6018